MRNRALTRIFSLIRRRSPRRVTSRSRLYGIFKPAGKGKLLLSYSPFRPWYVKIMLPRRKGGSRAGVCDQGAWTFKGVGLLLLLKRESFNAGRRFCWGLKF